MKHIFIPFVIMFMSGALAQSLTSEELINKVQNAAETLEDADFLLTGSLIDPAGENIRLEIIVQIIPGIKAARSEFIQPDALADNVIVLDDEEVYNYIFLTNQVTIFPANDPDALGGLFPEGNIDQGFDLTFDPEQLFVGWSVEIQGYSESPLGNVYDVRLSNDEPYAFVSYVNARILDESWVPYTLDFYDEDDSLLAQIQINDFVRDQGLNPLDVTFIPSDAEVIDER